MDTLGIDASAEEIDMMMRGRRHYVVAHIGRELVGYCGLLFAEQDAHVTNIAVHPEWQRRGIATDLLLELAWKARERECQALTLEVRMSNTPAQELYRRFGFAPAGVRKKYYENVEDAMVMWCHEVSSPEYGARLREIEMERANAHR
jgi:ribosomal-protein-alanine N-acetyltransferase